MDDSPTHQAVILCGGKGTRLGELTRDIPKPLLPVAGEVLLDRTLRLLASQGMRRVLLIAGHLGEQIEERYAAGEFAGLAVEVFREPAPLGTAGALPRIVDRLEDSFLLVYGDVFIDFDVARLLACHARRRREGALATLLVRPSDHPWDSHLVDADADGWVRDFVFEQLPARRYRNCGNVAIYACQRELLRFIPRDRASDFGRDVFPRVLAQGGWLATCELETGGFVRDMGTPDRLAVVERYLARKAMAEFARAHPRPLRVAFLDRDGTLNVEKGLLDDPAGLELLPGAAEAVARLVAAGWRCYILTNQPQIARGLLTPAGLEAIHARLLDELGKSGGRIEAIYHSPYHPETHHEGGVRELRRASDCRKPNPGMLFQAAEEHGLDLAEAVMIGDSWRDVEAGRAAGVRTVLLDAGGGGGSDRADLVAESLGAAVSRLLEGALGPDTVRNHP